MKPEFITNETATGVTLRWKHNYRAIKRFVVSQRPRSAVPEDDELLEDWLRDLAYHHSLYHQYTIPECYRAAAYYAEALVNDLATIGQRTLGRPSAIKHIKSMAEVNEIADKVVL